MMQQEAIFGSFDGMTCVLGVIAAGYLVGNTRLLLLAAVGLAVAEAVAMFGGEFLSETGARPGGTRRAAVIGGAACAGALLPALPFLLFARPLALLCTGVLLAGMSMLIAQARVPTSGALRAYLQTFGLLLVAALLSIGATLACNLVG